MYLIIITLCLGGDIGQSIAEQSMNGGNVVEMRYLTEKIPFKFQSEALSSF